MAVVLLVTPFPRSVVPDCLDFRISDVNSTTVPLKVLVDVAVVPILVYRTLVAEVSDIVYWRSRS